QRRSFHDAQQNFPLWFFKRAVFYRGAVDFGASRRRLEQPARRDETVSRFLQDHPRVSADLRSNPNLVNNKKYLDKHDDLDRFLKRHPAVKREIVERPHRVFGNYYRDVPPGWARR